MPTSGSLPEEERERAKKLQFTERTKTSQQRLVQDAREKRTASSKERQNGSQHATNEEVLR